MTKKCLRGKVEVHIPGATYPIIRRLRPLTFSYKFNCRECHGKSLQTFQLMPQSPEEDAIKISEYSGASKRASKDQGVIDAASKLITDRRKVKINNDGKEYIVIDSGHRAVKKDLQRDNCQQQLFEIQNLGDDFLDDNEDLSLYLEIEGDKRHASIRDKEDPNKIKDNPDFSYVDLVASVGDLKSHAVSGGAIKGTGNKKTCRLTYLNGPESTGVNYPEKNVVIINSRPDKNIRGRIVIDEKGLYEVIPIEDIDLNQATFRIHRGGDEKLKFIIFVGDDKLIAEKYVNDRQGGTNKYTLVEVPERKAIESIAEYINIKIGIYNHGIEATLPTFDRRQTTKNENAKKYDSYEVKRLYEEAQTKYLMENPNRSRLSLRVASRLLGIPKDTIDRCLDKCLKDNPIENKHQPKETTALDQIIKSAKLLLEINDLNSDIERMDKMGYEDKEEMINYLGDEFGIVELKNYLDRKKDTSANVSTLII